MVNELYKSNGTDAGTKLLNDIIPGETAPYLSVFYQKAIKCISLKLLLMVIKYLKQMAQLQV